MESKKGNIQAKLYPPQKRTNGIVSVKSIIETQPELQSQIPSDLMEEAQFDELTTF